MARGHAPADVGKRSATPSASSAFNILQTHIFSYISAGDVDFSYFVPLSLLERKSITSQFNINTSLASQDAILKTFPRMSASRDEVACLRCCETQLTRVSATQKAEKRKTLAREKLQRLKDAGVGEETVRLARLGLGLWGVMVALAVWSSAVCWCHPCAAYSPRMCTDP